MSTDIRSQEGEELTGEDWVREHREELESFLGTGLPFEPVARKLLRQVDDTEGLN